MDVKILGAGCAACQSMYNDVNRIIERNNWHGIHVEYVQDIQRIMSYGVMSMPVLAINELCSSTKTGPIAAPTENPHWRCTT